MSKNNLSYAHNTTSNHLNSSPIHPIRSHCKPNSKSQKHLYKGALIILISTVYWDIILQVVSVTFEMLKSRVDALSILLLLPHTQRAGEITGAQALSLQCEGAVPRVRWEPLQMVIERDLLKDQRHVTTEFLRSITHHFWNLLSALSKLIV